MKLRGTWVWPVVVFGGEKKEEQLEKRGETEQKCILPAAAVFASDQGDARSKEEVELCQPSTRGHR